MFLYILHGQAYHSLATLVPSPGQAPRNGQLYVYDPQEACEKRQAWD